jgi:hypothetical protein
VTPTAAACCPAPSAARFGVGDRSALFVFLAIFGELLAPYDPTRRASTCSRRQLAPLLGTTERRPTCSRSCWSARACRSWSASRRR